MNILKFDLWQADRFAIHTKKQSRRIAYRWRVLNKMLNNHSVSKIKRGLYRLNDFDQDTSFVEVLNIVPEQ